MPRRIKINFEEENKKEIEIDNKKVIFDKWISLEKYETISNDIKNNILYNKEIEDKYIFMKVRFMRDVLDLCTNIDISNISIDILYSEYIYNLLSNNISNFKDILQCLEKEYDRFTYQEYFNILGGKFPSMKDLNNTFENISNKIKELPTEKLELIAKSIVWNNSPALGKNLAPIQKQ